MHAMKVASANFGKCTAVETRFNHFFVRFKPVRTILAIIFMTFATQASAVEYKFKQIFGCEVASQAYIYTEEGKLKSHKAEAFEEKVTFSPSF